MFFTLTCDGYGKNRDDGRPVDPGTYDYCRAAGTRCSRRWPGAGFVPARAARHTRLRGRNGPGRPGVPQRRDPRPVPGFPGRLPAAGAPLVVLRGTTAPGDEGEPVSSGSYPRHARRSGVARWAGQMAGFGPIRRRPGRGRQASPPGRFDPLVHPVAITEPCVIGDQIRLPAAWCDMPGCGAAFADPAALLPVTRHEHAASLIVSMAGTVILWLPATTS